MAAPTQILQFRRGRSSDRPACFQISTHYRRTFRDDASIVPYTSLYNPVGDDPQIVPHRTTRSRSKIVRSTCIDRRESANGGRLNPCRSGNRPFLGRSPPERAKQRLFPPFLCKNRNGAVGDKSSFRYAPADFALRDDPMIDPGCGARKNLRAYADPRFFATAALRAFRCICHRQRSCAHPYEFARSL